MAVFSLFAGASLFAVLVKIGKKYRALWGLLAAVCIESGVLLGLASGWPLKELLSPLVLLCALSMSAAGRKERGR